MKFMKTIPPINLQLFADPAPPAAEPVVDPPVIDPLDINLDDEDPFGEEPPAPPEPEPPADDTWFMPGIAKTKEDALKHFKTSKQYIKQLEAKNKELLKQTPEPTDIPAPDNQDEIDLAMTELGITEEEIITKPMEQFKKILRFTKEKLIPAGTQIALDATGGIRADLIKNKIKADYPDFDLDANEDKVAEILTTRFKPSYIKRHSLELVSNIVEELGGKKEDGKTSAVPHAEAPAGGTSETKAARAFGDKIRQGIRDAKLSSADITQIGK